MTDPAAARGSPAPLTAVVRQRWQPVQRSSGPVASAAVLSEEEVAAAAVVHVLIEASGPAPHSAAAAAEVHPAATSAASVAEAATVAVLVLHAADAGPPTDHAQMLKHWATPMCLAHWTTQQPSHPGEAS